MATARARRNSDIKLLVSATIGVFLVLFLVGGALLLATRGAENAACAELNTGSATEIRRTLQNGGPTFQTAGGACSWYFALEDGDIVAYRNKQPQGCTLRQARDQWECSGQPVDAADLAQYPVTIRRINQLDWVFVDLRPPLNTTVS